MKQCVCVVFYIEYVLHDGLCTWIKSFFCTCLCNCFRYIFESVSRDNGQILEGIVNIPDYVHCLYKKGIAWEHWPDTPE